MKKANWILLILILINNLLFSQIGYPKKIQIEKDTAVCISINQVKYLNLFKVDFDECLETKDSLLNFIKNDSLLISNQNTLILSLKNEISLNKSIIENCDSQKVELNNELKKVQRKLKFQKIKTGILGGFCTLFAITTLVLLVTN